MRASPPSARRTENSSFSVYRATFDEWGIELPVWTHRCLGIPGSEHQLDLLDRFTGNPGICACLYNPEADLRSSCAFSAYCHSERHFHWTQLEPQPLTFSVTHRLVQLCTQLP